MSFNYKMPIPEGKIKFIFPSNVFPQSVEYSAWYWEKGHKAFFFTGCIEDNREWLKTRASFLDKNCIGNWTIDSVIDTDGWAFFFEREDDITLFKIAFPCAV